MYQLALDEAPFAVYILDSSDHIVYSNQASSKMLGYSSEEFLSLTVHDISPGFPRWEWSKIGKELGTKIPNTRESQHRRKDGRLIPVEITGKLLTHEGKEYLFAFVRSVEGRKRVENALRESEHKYGQLIYTMMEGLAVADHEENFTFVNPAFCDMVGYTEDELLSMNIQQITSSEAFKTIRAETEKRKEGKKSVYEVQVRRKDGELRTFLLSSAPHLDDRGDLIESLAVVHDITERKEAEEDLRTKKEELERQHKLLDQKNIALREVMSQLVEEKNRIKHQVQTNIDELVLPILLDLRRKQGQMDDRLLDVLETNLKKLSSSFGRNISDRMLSLTHREIQICNMIRSGLTSKEIAFVLDVSYRTVETHRNKIRRKLGLVNKHINLAVHLKTL